MRVANVGEPDAGCAMEARPSADYLYIICNMVVEKVLKKLQTYAGEGGQDRAVRADVLRLLQGRQGLRDGRAC